MIPLRVNRVPLTVTILRGQKSSNFSLMKNIMQEKQLIYWSLQFPIIQISGYSAFSFPCPILIGDFFSVGSSLNPFNGANSNCSWELFHTNAPTNNCCMSRVRSLKLKFLSCLLSLWIYLKISENCISFS